MVAANEVFKRRGNGGPDELFWEESDIYAELKTELNTKYSQVSKLTFYHTLFVQM